MNAVVNIPAWLSNQTQPLVERWFDTLRQQSWQSFLSAGLPTRHDERWKYADLNFLTKKNFSPASQALSDELTKIITAKRLPASEAIVIVCINGQFVPALSDLNALPKDMIVCDLISAITHHPELIKPILSERLDAKKYPFAALNMAMTTSGIFIHLPKHCRASLPIQLISISDDTHFISHPLHCLAIEGEMTLIEDYQAVGNGDYFLNTALYVSLGANAQLKHCKIQQESLQATHISHTMVQQQKDSQYTHTNISHGACFARDEVIIHLKGSGAECSTGGFYYLQQDNQYIDHHIDIMHEAAHTNSEMLYKGIIDKKARAVFNGRLFVQEGAQKILAYQANHNLLISNAAEVYSKPELEIYADDVKCKHGATTGQLDQEALFYLRARGIDYRAALSILLEGFAEDIFKRIEPSNLRSRMRELL